MAPRIEGLPRGALWARHARDEPGVSALERVMALAIAFGKITITYNTQAMTGVKDAKPMIGSWDVTTVTA